MSAVTKIVVFGATGNTGLAVVQLALQRGLQVTTFVRDPEKLPPEMSGKVTVFQGDVLNKDDVKKAVDGQHGVVVTLGTRNDLSPTTVMSEGSRNITEAMKMNKVKKISACISGFLFYDMEKVPPKFHDLTADHHRQAEVLKESGLEWIVVCPPHISDEPASGKYVVTIGKMPSRKVSKFDLATLLLDSLNSTEYLHQLVGIGYNQQ